MELLDRIERSVDTLGFSFRTEKQLHDLVATLLDAMQVSYQREVFAGPRDRFDFLCSGGLVLEVKINGSFAAAMRQAGRYCERPEVTAVAIIATCPWARSAVPNHRLQDKTVRIVRARRQAF